jgi:hypothetical protein
VRRLLTWLVVTLGIAALVRRLRRRSATEIPVLTPENRPAEDPAAELRRTLDQSRAEEPAAGTGAPEGSVEERRAQVHAEGRAALDDMRSSDDG